MSRVCSRFDAVRTMPSDEVRLDLINHSTLRGVAEVGGYFHKYEQSDDWRLTLGRHEIFGIQPTRIAEFARRNPAMVRGESPRS